MDQERSITSLLLRWRRLLIRVSFAAAIVAVVVSLLLPQWYTATAVVSPPQEGDSGPGLMQLVNQLGTGIGLSGRGRGLAGNAPEVDLMIGALKSRRLRGQVVDAFGLVEEYDAKSREHAIKELGEHLEVNTTPEGFVEVKVEARDKQRAADMANAFVSLLDAYNRKVSVEDATRTVEFIRSCLDENQERQERAANALREFQEKTGVVELGEQTRVTVEAIAALEAERARLEIQRGVLEHYATDSQPQLGQIDAELREVAKRLDLLRGRTAADSTARGRVLLPLGDLPDLGLQYVNLKREVLVREKVFEFLTSQLEEARIREARDLQTVRVLDDAVPPIRKSRPRRSIIVILTAGLAFALSIGVAVGADALLSSGARQEIEGAGELRWLVRLAERLHAWGGPRAVE